MLKQKPSKTNEQAMEDKLELGVDHPSCFLTFSYQTEQSLHGTRWAQGDILNVSHGQ